jgi:hypothetical protein|tara:strand:+ start:55728 stop:56495 length:768 start_codon:yes stop_codon:yes gene_type:complete
MNKVYVQDNYVVVEDEKGIHHFPKNNSEFEEWLDHFSLSKITGRSNSREFKFDSISSWFNLDNVTILGGFSFLSGNDSTDSFYNCDFIYSDINGILFDKSGKEVYLENCTAYRNLDDGFDYDSDTIAIEVNCVAFENGYGASTGINNGSTAHSDAIVLRINGIYHSNEGPNVHDVNNAKSLNIDCIAYNSTSTIAGNKSDFACGTSTDATQMWLDGCATKTDDSFGAEIRSTNADIYVRNSIIKNVESGTTLTSY